MSMNGTYTPGRGPTISSEFRNYIQDIFAELTARLEGLDEKVSVNDSVFSLAFDIAGEEDYQQPIYYHKRTDGKAKKELAFVLRCRSGLSRERRYLASRVLDQVAAEFRALLFEYTEEHLDAAISSAEEKAQEILLSTYRLISTEMYKYTGCILHNFDILSLTEYEKERASGSLLFLRNVPDSSAFDWKVSALNATFEENNLRMIRKLLAGVTPDAYGQAASTLVFVRTNWTAAAVFCGAAPLVDGEPLPTLRADSVQVTILGPLKWELSVCGCPVFRKEGSDLRFPVGSSRQEAERKKDAEIRETLEKAFGSVEKMDQLVEIIRAVEKQRHGAAVLVADWRDDVCGNYLEDLVQHDKALRVSWGPPRAGRSGAITNAAKMDGAILVDVNSCEVVALATIVQAVTCTKGKASRGSRFNSINNAACFLKQKGETVTAFVFSSDGGIDILPQENL